VAIYRFIILPIQGPKVFPSQILTVGSIYLFSLGLAPNWGLQDFQGSPGLVGGAIPSYSWFLKANLRGFLRRNLRWFPKAGFLPPFIIIGEFKAFKPFGGITKISLLPKVPSSLRVLKINVFFPWGLIPKAFRRPFLLLGRVQTSSALGP